MNDLWWFSPMSYSPFFFFNDTATTEIYTLSLHDALPISTAPLAICAMSSARASSGPETPMSTSAPMSATCSGPCKRSEEHTSELQSQSNLVCRLLLEKKKTTLTNTTDSGWRPQRDRLWCV